jgi:hypothetical protein
VNSPRDASTVRTVVVKRLGPRGPSVGERLDGHPPVRHVHGFDYELARHDRPPRKAHRDAFGGQERAVAGIESFDDQVFDDEDAGHEPRREAADVHRPLQVFRAFPLGTRLELRPQVDGEDRQQQAREDRQQRGRRADDQPRDTRPSPLRRRPGPLRLPGVRCGWLL